MSFLPYPNLETMMSPGWEHRHTVEMAEAAREYDERTGTNQLIRDSEAYQRDIRRVEMLKDQIASTSNPHDRILLADEIERIERIITMEAERLGL